MCQQHDELVVTDIHKMKPGITRGRDMLFAKLHMDTCEMSEACLARVPGTQCPAVRVFAQGHTAGEARHSQAGHAVGHASTVHGWAQMRWDVLLQLQAVQSSSCH